MVRNIFLGSSFESLGQLREIAKYLNSLPDVKAIVWDTVFPPSSLVFDRLESLPTGFSGALFLAAPDYAATVRGSPQQLPNLNVIFEFGLFVGLLGRQRVALAKHTGVSLGTDFNGFTYIDASKSPPTGSSHPLSNAFKESIQAWIKHI
jgi:predicted nucleotide-binding protein